jgi:hypothetical protein
MYFFKQLWRWLTKPNPYRGSLHDMHSQRRARIHAAFMAGRNPDENDLKLW